MAENVRNPLERACDAAGKVLKGTHDSLLDAFERSFNDAFIMLDKNLNFMKMNHVAQKMFEQFVGDVTGKNILEVFPDIKKTERYYEYHRVIKTGEPFFEDDFVTPPKFGDVRLSVRAFKMGSGLGLVVSDLTERKRLETKFAESEAKYQSLVENSTDGIGISKGGQIIYANKAALEIFGFKTVEEISKGSFLDMVVPEDMAFIQERIEKRLKGEPVKPRFEVRILRGDGEVRDIKVRTTEIVLNGEKLVQGIYRDITERRKIEEALSQSEEKFRSVLDSSVDMIYRANLQAGTYDYVSPAAEKVIGYTPEEFIALGLEGGRSLAHPDDLDRLDRNVIELVLHGGNGEVPSAIEYRFKHKKLGYRWMYDNRSIVYDSQNEPVAVVGVLRDITEYKMAGNLLQAERDLSIELNKATSLQEGLQICLEAAIRASGMDCGGIYLVAELSGDLNLEAHTGLSPDFVRAVSHYGENSKNAQLVAAGKPVYSEHLNLGLLLSDEETREGLQAIAVIPVIHQGKTIACVNVASKVKGEIPPSARTALEAIAAQMEGAIIRLKSQEALKESEQNYRELADSIADIFFAMDENLKYTYWNRASEELTGIKARDAIGKSISQIFGDNEQTRRAVDIYQKVLVTQQPQTFVQEYDLAGNKCFFEIHTYPSKKGLSVFVKDITEHKQLEESLDWGRQLLESTFGSLADAVFILDDETKIVDCNRAASVIFGYSLEEMKGRTTLFMHVDEPHLDEFRGHLNLALKEEGSLAGFVFRMKRKDGSIFPSEHHVTRLRDETNNFVGWVSVVRDVTERKQAEEALVYKMQIQELIARVTAQFGGIAYQDIDGIINDSLRMIGEFLGAHRLYVNLFEEGKQVVRTTHQWCHPGIEPVGFEQFSLEPFAWAVSVMSRGDIIRVDNLDDLPQEACAEKSLWQDYGVKSIVGMPLIYQGLFTGFMGCSDERNQRIWKDDEIHLLRIIGDVLENIIHRKKVEEALRESEEKFRTVLENSVDVMYQVNFKTGKYDYLSPSSKSILGYTPEEIVAITAEEAVSILHPNDLAKVREHFKQLAASAKPGDKAPTIEYRVKHKESDYRWVIDSSSLLFDEHSNPVAIVGTVHDITERRKWEEALKESEERYRALVDTAGMAGEGIMIVERDAGERAIVAFANETLARMLGYKQEEMIGMLGRELFLPGDRVLLHEKHRRKKKGERLPSHSGVMALRKDGSMLPIELSMGSMNLQGKPATVVYIRDVTDRKAAEEALRQSEEKYRLHFETVSDVIYSIDTDYKVTSVSPSVERVLGYKPEEILGKRFTELNLLTPDSLERAAADTTRVLRGERVISAEYEFITKDSKTRFGEVSAAPLYSKGGKVTAVIAVARDVTERKMALEKLQRSEEHFRAITENAHDAIVIVGGDGTIAYGSPSIGRMLGYKQEELIGSDGLGFAHPDDMPGVINDFAEIMKGPDATVHTELRIRHKDGSWRVVEAMANNLLDNQSVGGIVVNWRDVTERKKAEEERVRHTKRVEALHAIAQAASQTLELEELLNIALGKTLEVMEADLGGIYLMDVPEKEIVLRASKGLPERVVEQISTMKLGTRKIQEIQKWAEGSLALEDVFTENIRGYVSKAIGQTQIKSYAVVPFFVRGQLQGLIAVGTRVEREFSSADMDLLKGMANQIGIGTHNAMLYEEVRALIRETLDAQERERERVCLEVHDGVAQTLVAAFQYLQTLEASSPDDKNIKGLIAKATVQVKNAIQESREVINSLQPATLREVGLVATLRYEMKRLEQETGLRVEFKADDIRLPKDIETGLYRIIHEAVFNARKHSKTKRLRVRINSVNGLVKVEVKDWGKGFNQARLDFSKRRGTGLFSIRKRAELMKGTCDIKSAPGQGTTVHVEIPFTSAKES